jgi:hypothetical protein
MDRTAGLSRHRHICSRSESPVIASLRRNRVLATRIQRLMSASQGVCFLPSPGRRRASFVVRPIQPQLQTCETLPFPRRVGLPPATLRRLDVFRRSSDGDGG